MTDGRGGKGVTVLHKRLWWKWKWEKEEKKLAKTVSFRREKFHSHCTFYCMRKPLASQRGSGKSDVSITAICTVSFFLSFFPALHQFGLRIMHKMVGNSKDTVYVWVCV